MAPELHMDLDPLTLDLYLEQSEGMLGLVDIQHAMHLDLEQALVLLFLPRVIGMGLLQSWLLP